MSLFGKIFKKEEKLPPIDLSVFKTDIHSHLIPGIDDGSKDLNDSLNMLKKFESLGFQKVITTPHVMCDFYKNTPENIREGKVNVQKALKEHNINIQFEAAAEYNLDDGLSEKIESKTILKLQDNYVLFELPFLSEPPNLQEIVFAFQTAGYRPILAHPERYGYWYNSFDKYQELRDKGILLQLNLLSLTGHYSPETRKVAEKW